MLFKKIKYATAFWLNNYLSDIDLVYKYKLKTSYKIPKLEKITLSLNLNKISSGNKNTSYINNIQAQRLFFIYVFSIFTVIPFIKINSVTSLSLLSKGNENEYNLILNFKTDKQIEAFTFTYFIETWLLIKNYNLFIFKKPFFLKANQKAELKSKLPLSALHNFNIIYNLVANEALKDNSLFFITFTFTNLIFLSSENCIKNLPFFWKTT